MTRKNSFLVLAAAGLLMATVPASLADDDRRLRFAPRVEIKTSGTYLGVTLEEEVEHPEGGARVMTVVGGSPADNAGLESGDIIVGAGSRTVRGPAGLRRALSEREPGDELELRVLRDGREIELDATLADRKAFSRTINGQNWEEFGEKMAALGQEWGEWGERYGEALGEKLGEQFGDGYEFYFENGQPGWNEEQREEFEERMEELRERLADIQIDIPNIEFNGQNGLTWFSCSDDETDCRLGGRAMWNRPILGVQLVETTRELRAHLGADEEVGVLVSKVVDDSVAEDAGIAVGDLILRVGDEEIRSSAGLRHALRGLGGETVTIQLLRDGVRIDVDAFFPEPEAASFGPRASVDPRPVGLTIAQAPRPPIAAMPKPLVAQSAPVGTTISPLSKLRRAPRALAAPRAPRTPRLGTATAPTPGLPRLRSDRVY